MSEWRTPRTLDTGSRLGILGSDRHEVQQLMDTQTASPLLPQPQSRPKVATIGPTPQIEAGELSPLPSTPRIPRSELDSSFVSQRLFQSPAPAPVSSLRLTSPPECEVSPSDLLMTQSQPVISPTSETNRNWLERRHQLNTERQLLELQQQVHQLGNMLDRQKRQGSTWGVGSSAFKNQVEQLTQERGDLLEQLESRDQQLAAFKSALVQLNSEYQEELAAVKEEAQQLTRQVEEKSTEYRLVAAQQEETLAKYNVLEKQHNKSLKTIHGLQSYLGGLPAKEEMRDLKAKVDAGMLEVSELRVKSSELDRQLMEVREQLRTSEKNNQELEVENRDLSKRNVELTAKVNEAENIRLQARGLGKDDLELLIFDKKELSEENEKLRTALELRTKRFHEEKNRLEEQVARVSRLLEESSSELQRTATDLRLSQGRCQKLEQELKEKTCKVTSLSSRLSEATLESRSLHTAASAETRLQGHYTRLARCMGRCIGELRGLNELCEQVIGGTDPNMSMLLGVKEMDLMGGNSVMDRDTSRMTVEEKLELVSSQLKEVQRVQEQVKDLRARIADKYAENLADNMTTCVTQ